MMIAFFRNGRMRRGVLSVSSEIYGS